MLARAVRPMAIASVSSSYLAIFWRPRSALTRAATCSFGGPSVAGDSRFYLQWRVFVHRKTARGGDIHHNTARFRNPHCRFWLLLKRSVSIARASGCHSSIIFSTSDPRTARRFGNTSFALVRIHTENKNISFPRCFSSIAAPIRS